MAPGLALFVKIRTDNIARLGEKKKATISRLFYLSTPQNNYAFDYLDISNSSLTDARSFFAYKLAI